MEWVRCTGKQLGFVIIILRSDMNDSRKKLRIFFGCEHSGIFRESKSKMQTVGKIFLRIEDKHEMICLKLLLGIFFLGFQRCKRIMHV